MPRKMAAGMEEPLAAAITVGPTIEERDTDQFVVFTLGNEEYGVGILDVREIVKTGTVTMIPNSPNFLRGVINLRSKIVGVIDLEKRFMMTREEEHTGKHIVIAEIGDGTFGLLVDEVTDVLRLPKDDIKLPPEIITKKIGVNYIRGIGTLKDKLIILLDLERVLSEKEIIELAKASAREYRNIKTEKEEVAKENLVQPMDHIKPEVKPAKRETLLIETPEEEAVENLESKELLSTTEQSKPKRTAETAKSMPSEESLAEKPTE